MYIDLGFNTSNINLLDLLVAFVVVVLSFQGAINGIVRELSSGLTTAISILISLILHDQLNFILNMFSVEYASGISILIIFILTESLFNIFLIKHLVQFVGVLGIQYDIALGFICGILKGILLAVFGIFIIIAFSIESRIYLIKESKFFILCTALYSIVTASYDEKNEHDIQILQESVNQKSQQIGDYVSKISNNIMPQNGVANTISNIAKDALTKKDKSEKTVNGIASAEKTIEQQKAFLVGKCYLMQTESWVKITLVEIIFKMTPKYIMSTYNEYMEIANKSELDNSQFLEVLFRNYQNYLEENNLEMSRKEYRVMQSVKDNAYGKNLTIDDGIESSYESGNLKS